ncbi:hypothetical protein [Adlercreutzia caecimuris]|uniref:hypothetical protein n=1 Tax=Adlercreutzia caecimuris TaxID=671266 RepID=UPI00137268AE|nr:hypothetical protein [Adlercreutzia caecimuris]NBJ67764.1 hypothetical protein [Adlercreutzia caecimuris]
MGLFDFFRSKKTNEEATLSVSSAKRHLLPRVEKGDSFPLGVKGLRPLATEYIDEGVTCYIFDTDDSVNSLIELTEKINTIISEASDLIYRDLPPIEKLNCSYRPELAFDGRSYWGFCRAEYSEKTRSGAPNKTPMKVYVETDDSDDPLGVSAVVKIDTDGNINEAKINMRGSEYYAWGDAPNLDLVRVTVGIIGGNLIIKKIDESNIYTDNSSVVLYDYREARKKDAKILELVAEKKKHQEALDEGNALKRKDLEDAGLDLSEFSSEKSLLDAKNFLDMFTPDYQKLDAALDDSKIHLKFSNLTKAGKLPKNVVEASINCSSSSSDDSIICYIKYLKTGYPNMAEVHLWHNHVRISASIRTVEGDFRITYIVMSDMRKDYEKTLHHDNCPPASNNAIEIFSQAVKDYWGL